MLHLNHRVWGRRSIKIRSTAFIGACILLMAVVSVLTVNSSRPITVFYNSQIRVVSSYHDNPKLILKKAGIALNANEEYELEETEHGAVLRVSPEFQITVTADGKAYEMVSRTDRVSNILERLGICLNEQDIVTPSTDTIFTDDCRIQVQRVEYVTAVRDETIEPAVTYRKDETMPVGTTSVKTKGVPGVLQVTYEDKVVDGRVQESKRLSELVTKKATDEVVLQGTAPVNESDAVVTTNAALNEKMVSTLEPKQPIAVNENGQPLAYKQCITGKATAYTASEGKHTATGELAQVGYIAVDPKEIPYGTMMYIKTADNSYFYGYAKAADTGGFTSGSVAVDLYFATESECIQFGVRDVEIYIL